jgi:hypothetical protein
MASTPPPSSYLTPTQRYAAGALMGLALHQAQLHQTHPLGLSTDEFPSPSSTTSSAVSEDPDLWVHHTSGLLRPVFMYDIQNYNCNFVLEMLILLMYNAMFGSVLFLDFLILILEHGLELKKLLDLLWLHVMWDQYVILLFHSFPFLCVCLGLGIYLALR